MNFCRKCGAELNEIAVSPEKLKKCPICGADLKVPSMQYAGFSQRFGAHMIDSIIIGIFIWIYFVIVIMVPTWLKTLLLPRFILVLYANGRRLLAFIFTISYLSTVLSFFYFLIIELATKFQTIGKIVLRIQKVDRNTLQIQRKGRWILLDTVIKSFICLIPLLSLFLFIDIIAGLIHSKGEDEKKYRLSQNWEKTYIIKIPRKKKKKSRLERKTDKIMLEN
ncbi:MAG: RDD family protein [Promethearchaeota archaeon]